MLLCCIVWVLWAQAAQALQVPPLKGRINDYAYLLDSATTRQLETNLAELESTDSTQIVVLTIPSLEGDNLEVFSLQVVEQWQIGQKGKNNSALLLIAKNDRKIRIEVGYGLESRLTDLICSRIIHNIIIPQFKMGQFDQGIISGVAAMTATVRGEFTAETPFATIQSRHQETPSGPIGILALLIFINMLGRIHRGLGTVAGGVLAPIAGVVFLNLGLWSIVSLIPLGLTAGFLMSLMGGPFAFGRPTHYYDRYHGSGFGDFSGGGGASGEW